MLKILISFLLIRKKKKKRNYIVIISTVLLIIISSICYKIFLHSFKEFDMNIIDYMQQRFTQSCFPLCQKPLKALTLPATTLFSAQAQAAQREL